MTKKYVGSHWLWRWRWGSGCSRIETTLRQAQDAVVTVAAALILLLAASYITAGPSVEGGKGSGKITTFASPFAPLRTGLSAGLAATVASKTNYQGRLTDAGGNPLNGGDNPVFQLRDHATAGSQVRGEISQDTTWQGDVLVTDSIVVQPNVTLTVLPGTRVRFQHYRGYREPEKRLSLTVLGRIVANGNAAQPIYFTSDATEAQNVDWPPQNGDWSMLRLKSPTGQSSFHYCVFEFAQQGLNVTQGSPDISHSVFRWNNWEGVYFESYCQPTLKFCHIVENGYNGLAAEQRNTIEMAHCEVWRNGTNGVHIDDSTAEVRLSWVHDNLAHGLSVDDNATLRALGDAIYNNHACGIGFGQGNNTVEVANLDIHDNTNGNFCGVTTTVSSPYHPPISIDIGFQPDQSYALGYIPSDKTKDQYMYIYPDDETRRIVRKIGNGLGMTWSLAWHNQSIWTATLSGHVYRLDPQTGNVLDHFVLAGSSQPWGMTFDDEGYMWVVDFAERKLFRVNPSTHAVVASFPTPNPNAGGCKGVTWDGTYLNVMGWVSPVIYQMDKAGNLVNTISLDRGGFGGIAWDGEHFWVPSSGRILKYDGQGHRVGWIYAASEGTWDMTWDGTYLWASQRTNENWFDEKIFQLEILEDHDHGAATPTATPTGTVSPTPTATATGSPPPTSTPTATATPGVPCENILSHGDFEAGLLPPWGTAGSTQVTTAHAHGGAHSARLGGANNAVDELFAGVELPPDATSITLSYWWYVESTDPDPQADLLTVLVGGPGGEVVVETLTSGSAKDAWHQTTFDLSSYAVQQVGVMFHAETNQANPTSFYVDDVEVQVCGAAPRRRVYLPVILKSYS